MKYQKKCLLPYIKKKRFYNHKDDIPESFLFKTMGAFIGSLKNRKQRLPKNLSCWIAQDVPQACSAQPIITWIGHATFLIQMGNVNILTDPIFWAASFFYPRILPPGILLENLPKIDVVLLSHNHRDHMDAKSLLALQQQNPYTKFLVPKGDKVWFDKRNFKCCSEYTWWEYTSLQTEQQSGEVVFSFLPAVHWSQRRMLDKNKSLWGSWLLEWNNQSVYFAGDTAYSKHFKIIAQECSPITIALMPIGPCDPHPHMRHNHVSAQEAGKGFLDLQARNFIPMHWGTFQFGIDHFETPINRLQDWWQQAEDMQGKILHLPKVGQIITFK